MRSGSLALLWCFAVVTVVAEPPPAPYPLVAGLGVHSRPISTHSAAAQRYFDQGLNLYFGFNHFAALASFAEAARLDPSCAMAHWGIALANGPDINSPDVPAAAAAAAVKDIGLARSAESKASPVERALIAALATRCPDPQPADRSAFDRAYSEAMRRVWERYPQDDDVAALFAESLMDLRPWDQWTAEGRPQPGTEEVLGVLQTVLRRNPAHPFANHLYIHALEASPNPERALAAADRLRTLQPGLPHNVHMPSHIYIRVGRWQDAIESNQAAIAAQHAFHARTGPARGSIPLYNAHNEHMLAYAAMMTGEGALAMEHIRAAVACFSADYVAENAAAVDSVLTMPAEVLVRFGRWDQVLAERTDFSAQFPFSRAFVHAAREIAFAAKGDTAAARRELEAFRLAAAVVPPSSHAGLNTSAQVLAVAAAMAEGELALREGAIDAGLRELRAAVVAEDALRYDEPPGWLIPARHSLGAALLAHGRVAEAESVYREDLRRVPNNGWSLYGLSQTLRREGREDEAADVRRRFEAVWARADLRIAASCLCQLSP